jgi:hypothetical protein
MKRWGSALVTAAALLALPAGVGAKSGFSVEEPQRSIEFSLPATNGYRVRVSATTLKRGARANVSVTASKGQRDTVEYLTRGRFSTNGALFANLSGVGRIALRFRPTRLSREAVPENCKGHSSFISHCVFRGTIELRGELGYTSLHSASATGKVTQSFRQVCDQREAGVEEGGAGRSIHETTLLAGAREGSPQIHFTAFLTDFGPRSGGSLAYFTTSSFRRRDGLTIFSSITARGDQADFSTPDSASNLDDTTVEPPFPFLGSATFHLDSPTSSSWEGSLSAELPGVGTVALAGPGFWSALCAEETCTKTLPSNVRIAFFVARGSAPD